MIVKSNIRVIMRSLIIKVTIILCCQFVNMGRILAPFLLPLLLAPAATLASASIEPEGALPPLEYSYTPKGDFGSIDDLPIYVAEQPGNPEPGRFVVWGYDISGWGNPPSAGRAFDMVDQLSELTGMTVIFPDFYRGEQYPPIESYRWETELQVCSSVSMFLPIIQRFSSSLSRGFKDEVLGNFPGWWADTVDTSYPSRPS